MSHERVYAQVEDHKIVAYPVTVEDINVRGSPSDTYYPCFFGPSRPTPNLTHKVVSEPVLIGSAVFVQESMAVKSIGELFVDLYTAAISYDEANQPYLDRSKIEPAMYTAFLEIVRIEVQNQMDAFAKTRGYDDMKSLCNYGASTDPIYLAEGQRGIYLRDTIWRELFSYFEGIVNGTEPIPAQWADIEAHYPALTWE